MEIGFKKFVAGATALAFAFGIALVIASTAAAAKVKSIQTEAKFISFDAEALTVTVKIRKTGKKPKDSELALKKGKEATFTVREGSVSMTHAIAWIRLLVSPLPSSPTTLRSTKLTPGAGPAKAPSDSCPVPPTIPATAVPWPY